MSRTGASRASAIAFAFALAALAPATARAQDLAPPPPLAPSSPTYSPGYTPGDATSGPMTPVARTSDDERSDSGLGLEWVWIDAAVGAEYVGLDSLNSSNLQIQTTKSAGPTLSLAAGVRLLFLTLGIRGRYLFLSGVDLGEVDAELGAHIPIGHVTPYFGVRGGYAFDGSLSSAAGQAIQGTEPSGLSVHGWNAGLFLGCDYYFNHYLSLGVDLAAELLFLQRPPAQVPAQLSDPTYLNMLTPQQRAQVQTLTAAYKESGSSIGFGGGGSLHLGVHF